MNRVERAPYFGLTKVTILAPKLPDGRSNPYHGSELSLCSFCRYAKWTGTPCGDDGGMDCTHPLVERLEPGEASQGDDCWGFRPLYDVDEAADILGILLRGEWPEGW